jgi:glycosyltransferase involved in cell wall biosynthesis
MNVNLPRVSVVLPTFNRARFLPEAFASIRAQTWPHWELIVVDDGSTDDTRALVEQAQQTSEGRIQYFFQQNRGAYAARNTGIDHATGDYIAFFDSDDLWLPGYLERCVVALDQKSDVDWVYVACRSVDESTGETIAPSTFYVDGAPRPFLALGTHVSDGLHVLGDAKALDGQLAWGLYAGLQNSLIRRRVFTSARFWDDYRVVEDVLFLIRALSRGLRIGYIDEVLVVYRVHADNSSASSKSANPARLRPIFEEEVRGYERLLAELPLTHDATAALRRQLASKYFWRLGYAVYWPLGERVAAMNAFRAGLRLRPLDWRMWRTYALCRLRSFVQRTPRGY